MALTSLPQEFQSLYLSLLAADGATTTKYLMDARYSRANLLELGIKRPHIDSVLQAIKSLSPQRSSGGGGGGSNKPTIIVKPLSFYSKPPSAAGGGGGGGGEEGGAIIMISSSTTTTSPRRPRTPKSPRPTTPLDYLNTITPQNVTMPSRSLMTSLGIPLSSGPCEVVVGCMRAFPTDGAIQLSACRALLSLITHPTHSRSNIATLQHHHAMTVTMDAMASLPTNRDVQEIGIEVILHFPIRNYDRSEKKRACDCVIASLVQFPCDRDLQFKALVALEKLIPDSVRTIKPIFHGFLHR